MQNDKKNDSRITPKTTPRNMPTFEEMMKSTNKPTIQDTDKKEFVSQIVEKISRANDEDFSTEVPSFDLGQQILAQHRKIAALKRKSPLPSNPASKTQPAVSTKVVPIQSISHAPASPQQKIIAEIIAREILTLTGARQ
ncbi:MAG: hypothetical protein WC496_04440 [Phycisphaerae bacterium]|jgi:hypothetical protein